jgi:hypothetical protein
VTRECERRRTADHNAEVKVNKHFFEHEISFRNSRVKSLEKQTLKVGRDREAAVGLQGIEHLNHPKIGGSETENTPPVFDGEKNEANGHWRRRGGGGSASRCTVAARTRREVQARARGASCARGTSGFWRAARGEGCTV